MRSCVLKLLVVLALLLSAKAATLRGRNDAPEVDDGDDWTANAELKTKLRDALSLCISPSASLRLEGDADGGRRSRREVVSESYGGRGSGYEAGGSRRRDDSSEKLDVGHVTPFDLPPCVATDHKAESDARKKQTQTTPERRSGKPSSGHGSTRRSGSFLHRIRRSVNESKNTDSRLSGSNETSTSSNKSSLSSTRKNIDVIYADSNKRTNTSSNTNVLPPTVTGSSNMTSDSADRNASAKYQYEVPDYGYGGSGSHWGGGGVGGGDGDYRFAGGGSYSGGNGGGSGNRNYGGYNSDRGMGNRGGYSAGGYSAGGYGNGYGNAYETSGGSYGNGRRNGFSDYGSDNYGNNRRYNGNGDSGGGWNNGNNRNRNEGCRDGSKCCESDGETYRKVGSGGYYGNRKDMNGRRGSSNSRNSKFNDDSSEDNDSHGSDSDSNEDDYDDDNNKRNGKGSKRNNSKDDDDRRHNGNRHHNGRGRRETRRGLLAATHPDSSKEDDEGERMIRIRISCAQQEKSHERPSRSVGNKTNGGSPVDDLGFPCEETMRRVLRKMLGDKDGAVAASAVTRCLLRISAAANNDVCDAADRLLSCLFIDVDALLSTPKSDAATVNTTTKTATKTTTTLRPRPAE